MTIKTSRHVTRAGQAKKPPSPRGQRGAAAIFAAVAIVAALAALLLSVNIGSLYFAQRSLQRLAVVGAFAGAQISSGCRNGGLPDTITSTGGILWNQVQQAIAANNGNNSSAAAAVMTGIGTHGAVEVGWVNTYQGQSVTDNGTTYTTASDGLRHFVPLPSGDSNTNANAVRVNLTTTVPTLLGMFGAAPVIQASATAMEQPVGSFSIGSTLASLSTTNSTLLNPLLGALLHNTSLSLSAVNYQNLASTQVSLANLMVAAGVTNLNSLLATNGSVALLNAVAAQVNPGVASLLTGTTLGSAATSITAPLSSILGNIGGGLNPAVTDAAALLPSLDLLDLLMGLGEAAAATTPSSFLTLSGTPSVSGLASTYVFLSVQQPMQPGFGPVGAVANTAQVTLHVRASVDPTTSTAVTGLNAIDSLINGLLALVLSYTPTTINIGVDLQVAQATGTLSSLACPSDTATPAGVPVANVAVTTNLASLKLGTFSGSAASNPNLNTGTGTLFSTTGKLLGITVASLTISTDGEVSNNSIGGGSGTAGPFEIYASPATAVAAPSDDYTFYACNDLVATPSSAASPNPCNGDATGPTTDPNNPQTPVTGTNLATGISTLLTSLLANVNITPTVVGLSLSTGNLTSVLSDLTTVLLTPLTNLVNSLLNILLPALGVQLGSGTVLMNAVSTGQPILVNTALPGTPGS